MLRNQPWVTLGLLGAVSLLSAVGQAVEVRNRVGGRELVRTVAHQEPTPAPSTDRSAPLRPRNEPAPTPSTSEPVPPPSEPGGSTTESTVGETIDGSLFLEGPAGGLHEECMLCGTPDCTMGCLGGCGRWVKLDYLLWWRKGRDMPSLAISSTVNNDLNNFNLGTTGNGFSLFGGETMGGDAKPGGRIEVGSWLDVDQCHGIAGRYWQLSNEELQFAFESAGTTPLGRPFTDVAGTSDSRTLAYPTFNTNGSIRINATSEVLGGDVLYRRQMLSGEAHRLFMLCGYQYSRIDEDLLVEDSTNVLNPPLGTQSIRDFFATQNRYNAGSIGLAYERYGNCWRLDVMAKVGFGNMNQKVFIDGSTINNNQTVPGGFLTTRNRGQFEEDAFVVSPEVTLNWTLQLTESLGLSAGYSFLYWNSIAQPEDQIPVGVGGPIVPSDFVFQSGSYWVHGLSLGGELRF